MNRLMLRVAFLLTLAFAPTGCNMWPWGGYTDSLTPGNMPAGQQAFIPRDGGASLDQSDFRRGH
jgi:hypothetical protein